MLDMANAIIRESYRPKTYLAKQTPRPMAELRYAIASAKRFILDGSFSEFLAVLSTVPFDVAPERRPDVMTSMRHSARLPYPKMFIQYDGRAFRRGLLSNPTSMTLKDQWGTPLVDNDEIIPNPSTLLEQLDNETIQLTYFADMPDAVIITPPFVWLYRTDDFKFPDNGSYDLLGGMMSHGISSFQDAAFAVKHLHELTVQERLRIRSENGQVLGHTHRLVAELGGLTRYIIALLATLNDVPCTKTDVRTSKGYLARGSYHKQLDHTVISLNLPRKLTLKTLSKRLIAMTRRRWHEVMPHWRINAKPNSDICEPAKHLWSARDEKGHSYCANCEARRVWIVLPHGRGDPTLGVVRHQETHITHKEN